MPGIPRTKSCQQCKRRRTKCDEKWPNCSACVRARLVCPGPSSAMKFVHNGQHRNDENPDSGLTIANHEPGKTSGRATGTKTIAMIERSISNAPSVAGYKGASIRSFLLVRPRPRPALVSASDRLSSGLVSIMEGSPDSGIFHDTHYLEHIPQRISLNPALRDSVAYWCSSWADFKKSLRKPSVATLKTYGKALQSLAKSLGGPKACTVETIAAATLIEKAATFYDDGLFMVGSVSTQKLGIVEMIKRKGLPNFHDPLHVALLYETSDIMFAAWMFSSDFDFLGQSPWQETMEDVVTQICVVEETSARRLIDDCIALIPVWIEYMGIVCEDPVSGVEEAGTVIGEINDFVEQFHVSTAEYLRSMEEKGEIIEMDDPGSFVGRKYSIKKHPSYRTFMDLLLYRLWLYRILIEFGKLYPDLPLVDEDHKKVHRQLRHQAWMLFPFVEERDPLECYDYPLFCDLSFQIADEEEKDHILEIVEYVDSVHHQRGHGNTQMAISMARNCHCLLGYSLETLQQIEKEMKRVHGFIPIKISQPGGFLREALRARLTELLDSLQLQSIAP